MEAHKLEDMVKGWFVGNFTPAAIKSEHVEVAVKRYSEGEKEERHHHRISTELTVVISGRIKMNGRVYEAGDIVTVSAFESTDFEALTDVINVVVKVPSVSDDKYIGDYNGV